MDLRLPTPAGELTRAEQKILDYINTNTDTFLFSSIGQLAQRLEISNATVSRFARHVGCRDFKALKSMVLEQSPGPAVKLTATLGQGERFSPQAWLERQRAYLETTIQQLSSEEFERAVEALCSARRVFLHGKNASSSMAQLLHFRLRRLGLQVSLLPSGGSELLEGLAQACLLYTSEIFARTDVVKQVGIRPPEIFTMAQALDSRAMCYTVDEFLSSFQEA